MSPSTVNQQLFEEILHKDGGEAALTYLVNHEEMTHDQALDYIKHYVDLKSRNVDEKIVFEHYCMRDRQVWIGDENSKCPICYTDGDELGVREFPRNPVNSFFSKTYSSMVLLKKKVLG